MTRVRISPQARWFWVVTVLAVASSVVSLWRPAPSAPRTVVSVARLLPPIFTASSAQGPLPTRVAGCVGKAGVGDQLSITVLNAEAVTAGKVAHTIFDTAATLDYAGVDGTTLANVFAQNVSLPANNFIQLNGTVSATITVKCAVTCDVPGPTPQRTYVTSGNSEKTVPDGYVGDGNPLTPEAPVATAITIDGGNVPFQFPVNFTIASGVTTVLNLAFENDACELWDISSLTADPADEVFKILPASDPPTDVVAP